MWPQIMVPSRLPSCRQLGTVDFRTLLVIPELDALPQASPTRTEPRRGVILLVRSV